MQNTGHACASLMALPLPLLSTETNLVYSSFSDIPNECAELGGNVTSQFRLPTYDANGRQDSVADTETSQLSNHSCFTWMEAHCLGCMNSWCIVKCSLEKLAGKCTSGGGLQGRFKEA